MSVKLSDLWTNEDSSLARLHGWDIQRIHGFPEGRGGSTVVRQMEHGYDLVWVDPKAMGYGGAHEAPPIDRLVAQLAGLGVPLYERAWMAITAIELHDERKRRETFETGHYDVRGMDVKISADVIAQADFGQIEKRLMARLGEVLSRGVPHKKGRQL